MVLRLPDLAEKLRRNDFFFDPLEAEIVAEKAASLGHHGRQVEQAIAALKAHEGTADERQELLRRAAHEVWAFFVQRELCGLRDQREVIRFYGIPQEVLVRLGAVEDSGKYKDNPASGR
jgi:hypothetical protein